MFISRNSKHTWKWYSKVVSKDSGGNEITDYVNFTFAKECEPNKNELNEYGSLEGELYFIDKNNNKRLVFPVAKYFDGKTYIEFKIMGINQNKKTGKEIYDERTYQQPLQDDNNKDMFGRESTIDTDDLPFY